ncbi:unnamed protein product, partial [Ilex paraguariensis]
MAGNERFELASSSSVWGFTANYPDGPRGSFSGPNFDRSGSFKESAESRMFGSGMGTSRGSGSLTGDLPPFRQSLMLEPIVMGEQKYTRSGELRRVLGISVGCTSEDNSFGATHLKPSPAVAMEDLKRVRASIIDTSIKARGRTKKLEELLHNLGKYHEAVTSKKQRRNELLKIERSGGLNLKMGIQIQRTSPELVTQKLDDRPKN